MEYKRKYHKVSLKRMEKLEKAFRLVAERGRRAVLSVVIAEAILLPFALAAGVIGLLIGGWTLVMPLAITAILTLNAFALGDVINWVYARLPKFSDRRPVATEDDLPGLARIRSEDARANALPRVAQLDVLQRNSRDDSSQSGGN